MNGPLSIVGRSIPVIAAGLLACGRNDTGKADDSAMAMQAPASAAPAESSAMKDMAGMPGMGGMMSDSSMAQVQAHMQMMDTVSAARLQGMLATHRQMVANMLSRMTSDMRGMNMSGDAAWTAIADSVRQDLVHLPELGPDELQRGMTAHRARVMRLMEMHRRMMNPR